VGEERALERRGEEATEGLKGGALHYRSGPSVIWCYVRPELERGIGTGTESKEERVRREKKKGSRKKEESSILDLKSTSRT